MNGLVTILPPRPSSAGIAREVLAWQLREWHIEGLCDDAALVITELVSNAIRHAGTPLELCIVPLENGVRLEVRDASKLPLRPRSPGQLTEEGGRGLHIIDALATSHGVEVDATGKRVWAEMLLPA